MHVAFWAYLFLSPMQNIRGTGIPIVQYLMGCMTPLMLMVVFYANYKWLTPTYFVEGKHRYYLLINALMIILLVTALHYWTDFTGELFQPQLPGHRVPDTLDTFLFIVRDFINFVIFATVATCLKLSQQWYWAERALKNAESA